MTITSHIDRFNRIILSRADFKRLSARWNFSHGIPANDAESIRRDQWVAAEVSRELSATAG